MVKFSALLNDPDGKRAWITILNEKRNRGEFSIPNDTFFQVGELFQIVLSKLMEINDFNCASQCIILSQTFYKEESSSKHYLQSLVMTHPFWNQENF